jgi:lysophospholipase L1-like esterase
LVSCGGRGLIRDWQGVRSGTNAPQFYELALPDDPAAWWDHQRYVADAIGIELGQNDFSSGIPDQAEYVNAYVQFVEKLRRDAPQAVIFLMNSPMQADASTGDPRRAALCAYLAQVVAKCNTPKVILAPLRHYAGVPGNTHPTGADHAAMADELEPVFRRALGW